MPTQTERETITSHLFEYANDCGFHPLICRDYGSRSRGLDSEHSDYDAFFIFAQRPADYATGTATETYSKEIPADETRLDREVELHGWNLRRFIGNDGIAGSNPTAVEILLSNETYYSTDDGAIHQPLMLMGEHVLDQFKPYALINHYRSMAASNYGKYIEQSWARERSQEQFEQYANTPAGQTTVDSEAGTLIIGLLGYDDKTIEIPLDKAQAEGMIRRTTRDPTIKRNLNIVQALIKARYIEQYHDCPTMFFPDLLADVADEAWVPAEVYAETGDLISRKKSGDGGETIEADWAIHDWIESELAREVEPQGHVERQPDRELIQGHARNLYNAIDWDGTVA